VNRKRKKRKKLKRKKHLVLTVDGVVNVDIMALRVSVNSKSYIYTVSNTTVNF
jgi:hypothetical protein